MLNLTVRTLELVTNVTHDRLGKKEGEVSRNCIAKIMFIVVIVNMKLLALMKSLAVAQYN